MRQEKTIEEKIESIYENIINAYYDYHYIESIISITNYNNNNLKAEYIDYINCLQHFFQVTKRDYLNCLYKLLLDNRSFKFKDLSELITKEYGYNADNYEKLSKEQSKSINVLRNNFLSHTSKNVSYAEINISETYNQLETLIEKFNQIVTMAQFHKYFIDKIKLKNIEKSAKKGCTLLFNNETHKKIYGDNK